MGNFDRMNIRVGKSDIISKTNDIYKVRRQSSEHFNRLNDVDHVKLDDLNGLEGNSYELYQYSGSNGRAG
jgi:hypothetical protein